MTETLKYGYSTESTRQELSNEYQHDKVSMVFENFAFLVLWTKVLEGLIPNGKTYRSARGSRVVLTGLMAMPISALASSIELTTNKQFCPFHLSACGSFIAAYLYFESGCPPRQSRRWGDPIGICSCW